MRLAHEFPKLEEANRQRVADLSFRQALEQIATPRPTESENEGLIATVERAARLAEAAVQLARKIKPTRSTAEDILAVHAALDSVANAMRLTPYLHDRDFAKIEDYETALHVYHCMDGAHRAVAEVRQRMERWAAETHREIGRFLKFARDDSYRQHPEQHQLRNWIKGLIRALHNGDYETVLDGLEVMAAAKAAGPAS